jgi:hypothetical protein
MDSLKMATMTMLASTMLRGFTQREDVNMYHATVPMGSGGGQNGEGGHGLTIGGSSPPPRELGQLPLGRGGHGGPSGRPLEGGSSSTPEGGEGGGGGPNLLPMPPFRLQVPLMNRGLKGTTLAIFDRNHKNTKQYT